MNTLNSVSKNSGAKQPPLLGKQNLLSISDPFEPAVSPRIYDNRSRVIPKPCCSYSMHRLISLDICASLFRLAWDLRVP